MYASYVLVPNIANLRHQKVFWRLQKGSQEAPERPQRAPRAPPEIHKRHPKSIPHLAESRKTFAELGRPQLNLEMHQIILSEPGGT